MTAAVDVVVPLYRPGRWLEPNVRSVLASTEVRVRLILVDDTPNDPAVTELAGRMDVRLVRMPHNGGFAKASNAGIAAGDSPYVLLLNQDALIEPDYLSRLVARFETDPDLAAAAGKLLHLREPDRPPDGRIDTCGIEIRRGRRPVPIGQGAPDDGRYAGWREVFGVCAAAALYRRAALERVAEDGRVFDERFVMHKEDVDLAWRLRAAGYRAGVDADAIGYHARGAGRAPDRPGGVLALVRDLVAQERRKPRWVRQLAWRNQLLMLIKNEATDDFARSFVDLIAAQAAYLAVGLVVDPVGTISARFRLLADLPEAFARRRAGRNSPRVELSSWLP